MREWNMEIRHQSVFKPTDTHALLHKNSFHPKHTFKGIVKFQLICFYRICTDPRDAENVAKVLFKTLRTHIAVLFYDQLRLRCK